MRSTNAAIIPWIILGFVLHAVSRFFERYGDAAPYAGMGEVSGERLAWHVLALLLLVGAGACFIKVLVNIVRNYRKPARSDELVRVFEDEPAPLAVPQAAESFDPDAALARYRASRTASPITTDPALRGGFGRKGL